MQHHPSPSSSAAPTTPSELVSRFRHHLSRLRLSLHLSLRAPYARRSPPPDVRQKMQHPPSSSAAPKPRRRSPVLRSMLPSDFNEIKDPIEKDRITKCATLAIRDYNSQTQNNYHLVVVDLFTSQFVNGFLYVITFQAMNCDKEYATFEAQGFGYGNREFEFRKVIRIRMKGTSTWYNGTLMQLEDDAPIVMDVEDHKRDVYGLIKSAQQFRMPDVGSLIIKQDEGEETAGALPE